MDDKHVSKVSFHQLIEEAQERGGLEHNISKDFRVEVRVYGKEVHLWKALLKLSRHAQVAHGAVLSFMLLDGTELVDEDQNEVVDNSA